MDSTLTEASTQRRRFTDAQILGTVLLAGGALWLLDTANVLPISFITVLSILLIILGAGMMLSGGRPQAGVVVVGILLVFALVSASFFAATIEMPFARPAPVLEYGPVPFEGGFIGDVNLTPSSIQELNREYSFGVGDVTLDLSDVVFPEGETPLLIKMGAGHLSLILPERAAVRGHAEIGAGEVSMFGRVLSAGPGGSTSFNVPAASEEDAGRVLVLEIRGGFGEVEVLRAGF